MSNYPDGFDGDFGENKLIDEVTITVTFKATINLEGQGLTDWADVETFLNGKTLDELCDDCTNYVHTRRDGKKVVSKSFEFEIND